MGQLSTGLLLPEMKQSLFARTKGSPLSRVQIQAPERTLSANVCL